MDTAAAAAEETDTTEADAEVERADTEAEERAAEETERALEPEAETNAAKS
jgi:hypothetical protein